MAIKPTVFEFVSYRANLKKREFLFTYKIHFSNKKPLIFTERLVFPSGASFSATVPRPLLNQMLETVHLALGVSYYKLYLPSKMKLPYKLTKAQADFWNTLYRKGLGEFCYRNKLPLRRVARFPVAATYAKPPVVYARSKRVLSMIGGGKDSIVSTELLKEGKMPVTTLFVETQKENAQVRELLTALKLPQLVVQRFLDAQIFQPHEQSFNGHVPVSAMLAAIGSLTALFYDYQYVAVANEHSSNFGNLTYGGEVINHQWSKSAEFESLFQEYTRRFITPNVTYFSLLRHSHEIRIAKQFARYSKYFTLFSSCNRVAKITGVNDGRLWCGECAKCAFAFAMLAPFVPKKKLVSTFKKNLFDDVALTPVFRDLLGWGRMKPFDCVGTFEETRAAFKLFSQHYRESVVIGALAAELRRDNTKPEIVLRSYPAPTIPAAFALVGARRVLILGYAREGRVTEQYLKKYYPKLHIGIADQASDSQYLQRQGAYDVVIKTPGIPKALVTVFYTTATNLFLANVSQKIIGVTGTKGKSTTASLIYAILKEAKKKVFLLGNIGEPMLAALSKRISPDALFVLELSSYQLDDAQVSPHIAVATSLFPEHMNYHGSVEKYYQAKQAIVRFQRPGDIFVYNNAFRELRKWALQSQGKPVPYIRSTPMDRKNIPLLGRHNEENVRAAITVARLCGVSDAISTRAIQNFQSLPHRLQKVGTYNEITFYDDAISTTPESTIEAIKSIPLIDTIFLGGQDRGYDFSKLEKEVRGARIRNIVLFPDSGKRIFRSLKGLRVLRTRDMKAAVAFAYRHTKPGGVCLLSTASPSYSVWQNFIEKGELFQKYVRELH